MRISRRAFMKGSLLGVAAFAAGGAWPALAQDGGLLESITNVLSPDSNQNDPNGLMLPEGFSARLIAQSGKDISGYTWHSAPSGGGVFPLSDGGWIYVSNSDAPGNGGAGAIRFDAQGNIVSAYPVLSGTQWNGAGTISPWGTWLSSENHSFGRIWECDPLGQSPAKPLPGLGVFRHGAAVADPETLAVYLLEDREDGAFYRFVPTDLLPSGLADMTRGVLEVAILKDGIVEWRPVPRPLMGEIDPVRQQVPGATRFNRAYGAVFEGGVVYFVTSGDDRIWAYDTAANTLGVFYDRRNLDNPLIGEPVLSGARDIAIAPNGGFALGETSGNMELVLVNAEGRAYPALRLPGHGASALCGPAFTVDGTRLYFASKRGAAGLDEDGMVFEVSGDFASL